MAKKKSETEIISVCWTGKKFVQMPEDISTHSSLTLDELSKLPEVLWNEDNKKWEHK